MAGQDVLLQALLNRPHHPDAQAAAFEDSERKQERRSICIYHIRRQKRQIRIRFIQAAQVLPPVFEIQIPHRHGVVTGPGHLGQHGATAVQPGQVVISQRFAGIQEQPLAGAGMRSADIGNRRLQRQNPSLLPGFIGKQIPVNTAGEE